MIETLECLNVLMQICSGINNLKKRLFNSERKKEIGAWLQEVGFIVDYVAEHLDRGEYPHKACARMSYISGTFVQVAGDSLTESEETQLQSLLVSAVNIEKTYAEYLSLEGFDKTSYVQELYSIAGTLMGIADTLLHSR